MLEVANSVIAKLSKSEAKNYISQIIFDESRSNSSEVVFIAPNALVANYIRTKFSSLIANTFESLITHKPAIKIICASSQGEQKKSVLLAQNKQNRAQIYENYTFENFIVGHSNQLAFQVSQMVATEPGKKYNPLFIYGSTGLGKTHLLHSIGNYALNHGQNVICVTSEQFFNDFVVNVQNKTMQKFKEKYRTCDILLIDDVQFLAQEKSEKIREEFFHTFNDLREKKAQIVLTSDNPPKLLKGFEERLVSRFESGLIANITPPELDTKIRIIKAKCEFDGVSLDNETIDYIATNMGDNIREIEGALLSLNAFARLMSQKITLEFAKTVIKDQVKVQKDSSSIDEIIALVASNLNVKISEIKSKSKTKKIVEARRICIYLAKSLTPNSMPALAVNFGLKDHSAVSHNIKKINELMNNDSIFKAKIEEIKHKILQKR